MASGPWEEFAQEQGPWTEFHPAAVSTPAPETYSPVSESGFENFRAGMGQGMAKIARGTVNMLTPNVEHVNETKARLQDSIAKGLIDKRAGEDQIRALDDAVKFHSDPGSFGSDAYIEEHNKLESPLMKTKAGLGGSVVGQAAATLPLSIAGPAAGASTLPRVLNAMGQGGITGAISADPNERGKGAAWGATIGGVLDRAVAGAGRLVNGLVKKSRAAQQLSEIADLHGEKVDLPLAQAADDKGISGATKFLYKEVLPNVPGGGGLTKQAEKAERQFNDIVLKEAAPGGLGNAADGYANSITSGSSDDVHLALRKISNAFDHEYSDTVKSYAFNVPRDSGAAVAAKLSNEFKDITPKEVSEVAGNVQSLIAKFGKDDQLSGDNILRVKKGLAELGRSATDDRMGQAYYSAQDYVDGIIRNELMQGGKPQNLQDLARYESLNRPWANFLRVQRAAAKATDTHGRFSVDELKRTAQGMASTKAASEGTGAMQGLAELGADTVGQSGAQTNQLARALGWAATAGAGAFHLPAAMATYAGARGAAAPATQRALMGDTALQQTMQNLIKQHPELARVLSNTVTNAGAAEQ